MRELRYVTTGLLLAAALTACGDAPEADTEAAMEPATPSWVDTVAAVADAIEAHPTAADSVLSAHGMSRARLDSLLYEIAEDPALTEAYTQARQ